MAGKIDTRLAELGITLADPMAPAANYVPFVQSGNLIYVSGQVSIGPDGPIRGISAAVFRLRKVKRRRGFVL